MTKLIYANLFIDNDWDEKKILDDLHPLRVPSTQAILDSYAGFGHFISENSDHVLVNQKSDPDLIEYWKKWFLPAQEVLISQLQPNNYETLVALGISSKEERISNSLKLKTSYSADFFIKINSKDFLYTLANRTGMAFPESKLISVSELQIIQKFPVVIKFLSSSGGRGVLIVDEKKKDILRYYYENLLERHSDLKLLQQAYHEIKSSYYTVSDTASNGKNSFCFQVFYDESNSSNKHIKSKVNPEMAEASLAISTYLKAEGYEGSFGFDGFVGMDDQIFPAIDLNVRIDKSRLILNASRKFRIEDTYYEFRRERFYGETFKSFHEVENKINSILSHNDFFFIPVIMSNVFSAKQEKRLMEISFFVGSRSNSFHQADMLLWLNDLYKKLGIKK